ncbi:MAG: hypothetical protein FWD04_08410, partial [Conexibacteraceae bacterium]|nr:hypothetical protein [Conexibacteraceae bacterium]
GNGNGNGGGATGPPKKIHVRVMFRRAAHARFNGALKATTASCTARRMVYLWAGHRRLGSSRATAKGAFQFKERKGWHGKRLHASVTVLSTKAGTCTAGSSATIRG